MSAEVDVVSLARDVSRHDESLHNLLGWQKAQNGAIHRVEAKVDKLIWWIMGTAAVQLLGLIVLLVLKGVKV